MACAYCSLEGFMDASHIEDEQNIRLMVLFDNEEVGSGSLMGAESTFLGDVITAMNPTPDDERMCRRKSMILSCVFFSWMNCHIGYGTCCSSQLCFLS